MSPIRRSTVSVRVLLFCLLVAIAAGPAADGSAEDPVFSGPQPGETLAGFELRGVYDDWAGKTFDPIEAADGKPTLLIFLHKLTRPGFGLTRGLTKYAESLGKDASVYTAIVWLDDDKAKAEQYLTRARRSLNIDVPVGISVDGGEGPGAYGLNRNVELTILVADENKVVANFALIQPSMTDAVKIAGALAKVMDVTPPTGEQLQQIAFPGRNMQRMRQSRTPRDAPRRDPAEGRGEKSRGGQDERPAGAEKSDDKR